MKAVDRVLSAVGLARKSAADVPSVPPNWPIGWFQQGLSPNQSISQSSSVVEACIAAYAQTIAQLPPRMWRSEDDGSRTLLEDNPVQRVLNKPNPYQTTSDFLLNLVYSILLRGNGYWLGDGDTPKTHSKIYILDPRQTRPVFDKYSGTLFYATGGMHTDIIDFDFDDYVMVPSRYVGHVKLYTPYDPLVGVTPLQSAAASVAANNSIVNHQAAFFSNMSRPSGVLSTEMELTKEQITMLREAWNEQSKNLNSGGVPILAAGLKWEALSITSQDAELVAAWKMTVEDISRVFRVPPMLINSMENATFSNADTLMSFWLSSGLGFMIKHIEASLKAFFNLPPREYIELDTEILMRTNLEGRIKALGEAVTKGILSPNEARSREHLGPVEGGDMPRVQQQMVPLDWEIPNTARIPAPDEGDEEDAAPDITDEELSFLPILVRRKLRELQDAA